MILEGMLAATALLSVYNHFARERAHQKPVILNYINNANTSADHVNQQLNGLGSSPNSEFLNLADGAQNIVCSLCNKITHNPIKSLIGLGVIISTWIYYAVHHCDILLKNPESWCNWDYDLSLDQAALLKLLKQKISTRYILLQNNGNHHDFAKLFLSDISQELKHLDNYLFWQIKLTHMGLGSLFPLAHAQQLIEAKKRHLQHILKIFMQDVTKKYDFLK